MHVMHTPSFLNRCTLLIFAVAFAFQPSARSQSSDSAKLREDALAALKKAAAFYHDKVATHGGYAYYYTDDLQKRWGEGDSTATEIWVEPPGTPAVGIAYLAAYEATGDAFYLAAARNAALALVYGQLESGGWRQTIDFDPKGIRAGKYRNGKGGIPWRNPNHTVNEDTANYSSLDDNQTQSALLCLIKVDRALGFKDAAIHEAALYGLNALLLAQFPNGAFPQGFEEPVQKHPVIPANYAEDWPRIWPNAPYWGFYTLNDGLCDTVTDTFLAAWETYKDPRYRDAILRLGNFIILAQMPAPQPAWAQQYDFDMHPAWARRFEPPAISGLESENAIMALFRIHAISGDARYLAPIQPALDFLRKHILPDGRLPRYIELKTDRALYMNRTDRYNYYLTHDDTDLPRHYGWKQKTRIEALQSRLTAVLKNEPCVTPAISTAKREQQVRDIIEALDSEGRWISIYSDERLTGQPRFDRGFRYLNSRVFIDNIEALSEYLKSSSPASE